MRLRQWGHVVARRLEIDLACDIHGVVGEPFVKPAISTKSAAAAQPCGHRGCITTSNNSRCRMFIRPSSCSICRANSGSPRSMAQRAFCAEYPAAKLISTTRSRTSTGSVTRGLSRSAIRPTLAAKPAMRSIFPTIWIVATTARSSLATGACSASSENA
ncbi:Uncharacterised protein [Mycobacteroides abscessus subsp. abscessus]|nr:Uncharacterised protein [Mycobacteroides abscessus subsp. abscessus]